MTSNEIVPAEVSAEIAAIEPEVGNHRSSYWKGPGAETKQARLRALYAARDAGGPPPAKVDAKSAELLALEKRIQNDRAGYFKDEKAQERYRQLLASSGEQMAPAGGDNWRASPGHARAQLPPGLVAEWGEDFASSLHRAQDKAAIVAGALDAREFVVAQVSFETLPTAGQVAIYSELGRNSPGYVAPASDTDLNSFRKGVPGADALIEMWGRGARRKVGIFLDAVQRISDRLTDPEKDQFQFWWNACPVKERMLMTWAITS